MQAFVYFRTQFFEWMEEKKVEKRFYPNSLFRALDQALLLSYRAESPYAISKEFLMQRGASEIYAYGETPLTTMDEIARAFGLKKGDHLVDLGAGRGRAALFMASFYGLTVTAVEQIPTFAHRLQELGAKGLTVSCQDMAELDLESATHIYLYGTMLSDGEIEALLNRFPHGAKIISVSYPLSEYSEIYRIEKSLTARFPWGKTKVYLNGRTR